MIYEVKNINTGEFHHCKSVNAICDKFPQLKIKKYTIANKFKDLKKVEKQLKFSRWGYIFKASYKII